MIEAFVIEGKVAAALLRRTASGLFLREAREKERNQHNNNTARLYHFVFLWPAFGRR